MFYIFSIIFFFFLSRIMAANPAPPIIHEIPGERENTFRYFVNGYHYYRDSTPPGTTFRCHSRRGLTQPFGCSAIFWVESLHNFASQVPHFLGTHNHPPDTHFLLRREFEADLKQLAETTFTDPLIIFNTTLNSDK